MASETIPRKAAQYLRMSTDHQKYSLENQAAAIAAYAQAGGFEVIRSYVDAGKSGVTTAKRDGLKALLSDVLSGAAPYSTILVLDVSRWGRFQDPDEAAHYEFLCREAGVQVRYCAEAFENDATGAIMKQLKRVMAGEYSRELSEKSRFAKRRRAARGFAIGGPPPYGFRRQVSNSDGSAGPVLDKGDHKSRVDQDIAYAWGPPEEIANVRRIFHLFVHRRLNPTEIAEYLNKHSHFWKDGLPWRGPRVLAVLRCELAIGIQVYGRRIYRLDQPVIMTPQDRWLRSKVCEPVVEPRLFRAAQRRYKALDGCQMTDNEMIDALKRLLEKHSHLSANLINASPLILCACSYRLRFGSLLKAYELIGYQPELLRRVRHPDGSRVTHADLTAGLRRLYMERGSINASMIAADKRLPSVDYISRQFGSLRHAYAAADLKLENCRQRPRGGHSAASTSGPSISGICSPSISCSDRPAIP